MQTHASLAMHSLRIAPNAHDSGAKAAQDWFCPVLPGAAGWSVQRHSSIMHGLIGLKTNALNLGSRMMKTDYCPAMHGAVGQSLAVRLVRPRMMWHSIRPAPMRVLPPAWHAPGVLY